MDLRPISKHIAKGVPHGIFVKRCSGAMLYPDCGEGQQKTECVSVVFTSSSGRQAALAGEEIVVSKKWVMSGPVGVNASEGN